MSNKSDGNRFETEFCELLAQNGFWAHCLTQNSAGQPADIIAVKGDYHVLIDCKLVGTKAGFKFSRWEDNQRSAMRLFHQRGHHDCYLALKLENGVIRLLAARTILGLESKDTHSIPLDKLRGYTLSFSEFLGVEYEANRRWPRA